MMKIIEILEIIEKCEELSLPNGAKGAIWKEDLINKLKLINEPSETYNRQPKCSLCSDKLIKNGLCCNYKED